MEFSYYQALLLKQQALNTSRFGNDLNAVKRNGKTAYSVSNDMSSYFLEANTKEKEEGRTTTGCSTGKMDTRPNNNLQR